MLNQGHGLDSLKMALMGMIANFEESKWNAEKASKHGKAMLDLLEAEYNKTVDSFDWKAIQITESKHENAE